MRNMNNGNHQGSRGQGRNQVRQDKGIGKHILGGRRDGVGPHYEEGCNTEARVGSNYRAQKYRKFNDKKVLKTKMFIEKKDLVDYANEVGEKGHSIDVFKIEDDLYKVIVYEKED